jgi:type I restriction enzyme S subunit
MPEKYLDENADLLIGGGELVINLTAQSLKDEFLGRVCITGMGERCLLNQRLARLTPLLVSPKFILWILKSPHFREFVDGLNSGSLIQHMFTSQLEEYVFPLPPLAEQEAILDIIEDQLSIIDHLESELDAKLKNSRPLRQAILRSAFAGLLVPQDVKDEPATELLSRIIAARETRASTTVAGDGTANHRSRRGRRTKTKEHA